jgi:hypothetical protein
MINFLGHKSFIWAAGITHLNQAGGSVARGRFAVTPHGSVAGRDRGWRRLAVDPGEESKGLTQSPSPRGGHHDGMKIRPLIVRIGRIFFLFSQQIKTGI